MRLSLHPDYILRGWTYLPYAYCNIKTGTTCFISKDVFSFLKQCDGDTDVTSDPEMIKKYVDLGIIQYSTKKLEKHQLYKTFPTRYVKSAHWAITNKCNYKCKHCFISAPHFQNHDLSYEETCKIVDELASCGILQLSITGGEPLLRKDFIDILHHIQAQNIIVTDIYSNGSLVSKKILEHILVLGFNPIFHISYDGVFTHNWLRGVPTAETTTKTSINLLKQKGFKVYLSCCLYKDNLRTMQTNIEYFASLGVDRIGFGLMNPLGEWRNVQAEKIATIEDVLDTLIKQLPLIVSEAYPLEIDIAGFIRLAPNSASYCIPEAKTRMEHNQLSNWVCCKSMRNTLYINPQGSLIGCEALTDANITKEFPIILNEPLQNVLINGNPFMEFIDQRLKTLKSNNQECPKCSYFNICHGGCRGNASCYGGFWNVDPIACTFFKKDYYNKIVKLMKELGIPNY